MNFFQKLWAMTQWLLGKKFSGLVRQPFDPRDWKLETSTPIKDEVDLSSFLTSVKDQTWYNACTAFAIGELFNYVASNKKTFIWNEFLDFSEAFQWYMNRKREGTEKFNVGVFLRNSFKTVLSDGFCINRFWHFGMGWDKHPDTLSLIHASFMKLYLGQFNGYFLISNGDITTVKRCLSDGFPIVFGFPVDNAFMKVNGESKVDSIGSTKFYHAMLMVGYKNGYFRIRNSWGNRWGDNGYCWIKEELIKSRAYDIWTLR